MSLAANCGGNRGCNHSIIHFIETGNMEFRINHFFPPTPWSKMRHFGCHAMPEGAGIWTESVTLLRQAGWNHPQVIEFTGKLCQIREELNLLVRYSP